MNPNDNNDKSLETLQEIRSIMERSARFLSLSGWSGVWAGFVALVGAIIANVQLKQYYIAYNARASFQGSDFMTLRNNLVFLAIGVFLLALAGGIYFTYRNNKPTGQPIWNHASRKMVIHLLIPMAAGAFMVCAFLWKGDWAYVAPTCLIFYGLALINASKYTLSDIKYLGLTEAILGVIGLFILPHYGLYLWAFGFGILHIVYGMIMWRKYKQ